MKPKLGHPTLPSSPRAPAPPRAAAPSAAPSAAKSAAKSAAPSAAAGGARPGPSLPKAGRPAALPPPGAQLFEPSALRARGTSPFQPLAELPKVPLTPAPTVDRLPEPEGVLQGWWSQAVEFFQGRHSTRELGRARKTVEAVRALEPRFAAMSDAELRGMTAGFRQQVVGATGRERSAVEAAERGLAAAGVEARGPAREAVQKARIALYRAEEKVLEGLMPQAFATVREASRRATGMFPYEVQVMGGALMARGHVAEMYTGEGKTLAATMPAYLAALAGHGFHVATVNDYLARRDGAEMGAIFGALGLSVGILQAGGEQLLREAGPDGAPKACTRAEAYRADITYGTATELGFDYLRDNGVQELGQRVQRPPYGVLIDEIDAILIDEARVPLIIAEPGPPPDVEAIERYRDVVESLDWQADVEWNQEEHWASLTEAGADKVAKKLGVDTLYGADRLDELARIQEALTARFLLRRDEDYTVIGDRILTIGKNGHAQEGRRYAQGLHQAIEAKERVPILPDTATKASVTMRDYLAMYAKTAGMTGTALSASDLFSRVYGLDVVRVPPRLSGHSQRPIRVDHPDRVFKTLGDKLGAFLGEVERQHRLGRPVLIGTEWTRTAEVVAKQLAERGVPVRVLTAKNDAEEAEIIANAGRLGAVTVVTPRGGRGVDIKLGGSEKSRVRALMAEGGMSKPDALRRAATETAKERAEVLARGGLMVIGFEHCDSRRRDDQLRGRAARQGDPGATMFFTSLEDPLYDGMKDAEKLRAGEGAFDERAARSLTERALDHSESGINDELTRSVPYDEVLALHRRRFYEMREDVLALGDARPLVRGVVDEALDTVLERVRAAAPPGGLDHPLPPQLARDLYALLRELLPLPEHGPPPDWSEKPLRAIAEDVNALKTALLERRDAAVGEPISRVLERRELVAACDQAWVGHLDAMTALREGIGLRAYAQKDPRLEFNTEAAKMYDELVGDVRGKLARGLLQNMPFLADGRPRG